MKLKNYIVTVLVISIMFLGAHIQATMAVDVPESSYSDISPSEVSGSPTAIVIDTNYEINLGDDNGNTKYLSITLTAGDIYYFYLYDDSEFIGLFSDSGYTNAIDIVPDTFAPNTTATYYLRWLTEDLGYSRLTVMKASVASASNIHSGLTVTKDSEIDMAVIYFTMDDIGDDEIDLTIVDYFGIDLKYAEIDVSTGDTASLIEDTGALGEYSVIELDIGDSSTSSFVVIFDFTMSIDDSAVFKIEYVTSSPFNPMYVVIPIILGVVALIVILAIKKSKDGGFSGEDYGERKSKSSKKEMINIEFEGPTSSSAPTTFGSNPTPTPEFNPTPTPEFNPTPSTTPPIRSTKSKSTMGSMGFSGTTLEDDVPPALPMEEIKKIKNIIFLSHAKEDYRWVKIAAKEITTWPDCYCWYSERDLPTGEEWMEVVYDALEICNWFILFWSENSKDFNWVKEEMSASKKRAVESGIPKISTVILNNTPLSSMYKRYQGAPINSEEDIKIYLSKLKSQVLQ